MKNKQIILFSISLVFSFTVIVFLAKGPLPFALMGKTFEIRESNGSSIPTEDREKKLFITFGYFAGEVTGYDGCNVFKGKLIDLGMGQFAIENVSPGKNQCRHNPYPGVRYKSVSLGNDGAKLQFLPFGLGKTQKSLSLQ